MSVHELASRFEPSLRLPGRNWVESAAFRASRLNPGSTPVYLVNQPMVYLVNRSTGLDQSTPKVIVSNEQGVTREPSLFWLLRIEDCMRKVKEGIGSKGFMKRSQKGENRAPCDRTLLSCVCTGPWECLRKVSIQLMCPHGPLVCSHVDRATTRLTRATARVR
ncbi:hypothetical protein PIB30_066919 [Stylosanthes scabra]|uniref:Uncharacterized protein n=1 Tax=Stylosanthes scabra TaxID=79078 RepID=A0ABU6SN48_9FABA|nr:hypothetical protein [Stylosanthes scabra]